MKKRSAGLVLYRRRPNGIEVFLIHPGGPFWARKDLGAWSIPKGEVHDGEDTLAAAKREFAEETGFPVDGDALPLGPVRLRSGKVIHAWAIEGDLDPARIRSNTFAMEWPPRSGRMQEFPEADRGAWFDLAEAAKRISEGQRPLLDDLRTRRGS